MKFRDFEKKVSSFSLIDYRLLKNSFDNLPYLSRLLSMWKNKGLIISLKKGIYIINKPYYIEKIHNYYISNYIYSPSYISLETALSFYNIIPEKVVMITAISTKKNQKITNEFGRFNFYNIKKGLYTGFNEIKFGKNNVFFACKEKALFDFVYLNYNKFDSAEEFIESYRLDNLEDLNMDKINKYVSMAKNNVFSKFLFELINKYDGYNQI